MAIRKALLEQVICENDERATEIKWGGGGGSCKKSRCKRKKDLNEVAVVQRLL